MIKTSLTIFKVITLGSRILYDRANSIVKKVFVECHPVYQLKIIVINNFNEIDPILL